MRATLAQLLPLIPALASLVTLIIARPRGGETVSGRQKAIDRFNLTCCLVTAAVAAYLAFSAYSSGEVLRAGWVVLDEAGAVFLAAIALVGLLSAFASVGRAATEQPGWTGRRIPRLPYWAAFQFFLAVLIAVPLARSLILAWLLIEATTAVSALLVAFSGRSRALEAGWKYLVLTTFGLAIALLGVIALYGALVAGGSATGLGTLNWESIAQGAASMPKEAGLGATVLILVGLAGKVGWAPLHNWLPDAHSEAPAPISALLSAALLPAVALVAWRVVEAESGTTTGDAARSLVLAFGLISLAFAIPFLWQSLPWKRLLAYSSLEHMGVIGVAIGFGGPLAAAGLLLHVMGHALAKSLGFYASIPLLGRHPGSKREPLRGLHSASPALATAVGLSLAALAALPPSPIFLSEVLIIAGGIKGGYPVWAALTAVMLGLGFLGLAHALIEALAGQGDHMRWSARRGERLLWLLSGTCGLGLIVLAAVGLILSAEAIGVDAMSGVTP